MVEVAAIIAHAASTAFPPFWNIIAPAVAASGFPVMATQCRPCSTGFTVRWAETAGTAEARRARSRTTRMAKPPGWVTRSPGGEYDVWPENGKQHLTQRRSAAERLGGSSATLRCESSEDYIA